jgi:hypothetical protein
MMCFSQKRYGLIIHCRCRFVVGFGIDYNDIFRNLNHISILNEVSNFYAILLTQQGSLDNYALQAGIEKFKADK